MCANTSEGSMNKEERNLDTSLVSSLIFSDYLSKKFESLNSVQNKNSEENMVSSRSDSDNFFCDFSENEGRRPSDFREETRNNGSVLSLSPRDVMSLKKNVKKDKISTNGSSSPVDHSPIESNSTSMSTSMNGVSKVIIDAPEECVLKKNKKKYSENSPSQSNTGYLNSEGCKSGSISIKKSKTKCSVKKNTKKKRNSQDGNEKSFIDNLLEYYEVQSTPIPSEDEDHSENIGKTKHTNNHKSNVDQIRVNKKREDAKESNKKRRRSNSGDCLNVSSSEENKDIEFKNSDKTLIEMRKKRKSEHNTEQIIPRSSVSSEDSETVENIINYLDRKKSKSKKGNHKKFNHKSEVNGSGSVLDLKYLHKENYSINEISSSENTEEMTCETNIVQECFKQAGKHKRRKDKSKYIECSESDNTLHDVSCTKNVANEKQFSSFSENKQVVVEHNNLYDFKKAKQKNRLRTESSESELDISFSSIEKTKESKVNVRNLLSKNNEKRNLEDNKEMVSEDRNNFSNNKKVSEENNVSEKESPVKNKNRIRESVHSEVTFENSHHTEELNDNSQVESKKKHKSQDDSLVTDDAETPTKKKKYKTIDNFLKKLEKKIKRETSFNNSNSSMQLSTGPEILESVGKPKDEISILMNEEISICSDVKEAIESNEDSLERRQMNKDESTDTVQGEPDENSNMRKKKTDVCSDDLGENSGSDSCEEIERSVKRINRHNWRNMDLEDVGAEVLKNLVIVLPFNIPPLHVNVERPSRPTLDEIKASRDFSVKTGAYSQKEDQTIKNNWKRFCKEHNLNIEPAAFFKFPRKMAKEEKVKFMQYISHGLENRPPRRVYLRFKTIFGNLVKITGRFTKAEDEQIIEFMETTSSKKPFVDLGRILNRPSNSVERHYLRICEQKKIFWTPSKAEQLINCMLKVAKLESPYQLENQKLTAKQWKKVSKKMEGIPVIKLQRAWNITIYPRLFADGDLAMAKRLVIDILDERQETDWRLVDWKEISRKFPGFSPEKLYMMFKKLVIHNVPEELQKDLKKSIECLKEKGIAPTHKLRSYIYRNGHLVYEDDSDDDDEKNIKW
ncbi:uncharacterized protein isoform X1 [Leptinotarsa decemlineata]|uniref:uncharacterized protein isoform X1 n=1 Tax=Leptinotarsa decemlineata TaxID=7539 RepID=UPI003D30C628